MTKLQRILMGIIAIGIIVAGYQITLRVAAEQRNSVVEIVADLSSFESMSKKLGKSIDVVSKELRMAGVNSIAVSETTVGNLLEEGKIEVYKNSDIKNSNVLSTKQELFNSVNNYIIQNQMSYKDLNLIITNDYATYDFVSKSLTNRYRGNVVVFENQGIYGVLVDYEISSITSVSLGIDEQDLIDAKKLNFTNIIPRIENYRELTIEQIDDLYNMLKKHKVRTIIFAGSEVLGYDSGDKEEEKLQYIGEKFSTPGKEIITAILEKPSDSSLEAAQRGITSLAKYSKYINTKVFSVDTAQLAKLSTIDVVEQWGRAISQRNVRIIYLRPFNVSYKTVEQNFNNTIEAVSEISSRIDNMGMQKGVAVPFSVVPQNQIVKLIIAVAIFAAGILLLSYFINKDWLMFVGLGVGFLFICIIFNIPVIYGSFETLINKFFAFAAANIFPCLSALYLLYAYKKYSGKKLSGVKVIRESIMVLLISILIAVIGGIFVGALLSDSKYILKIDTFSGVKLSFLLPLAFFGVAFILKLGIFTDKNDRPLNLYLQTNKLINTTVTVKYVIVAGVILLGLLVILMRSGNTSAASSIELAFRSFLEKYLVARPRTKELIAFPILMLAVLCSIHKNKSFFFIVAAVGMIGIEDIVNSFCHLRMPVLVSALSSTYSLIFGIIIGSIFLTIIRRIININWKEKLQK